jgi:uncharacterized protein (DUF2237 family)
MPENKMILLFNLIESPSKNVLGTALERCCFKPKTGFYRNGFCKTGEEDFGTHIVCAIMTNEFLEYTKSRGNDLSTPIPQWSFPGLREGDKWCLCIMRWLEAVKVEKALLQVGKSCLPPSISRYVMSPV